MFVTRLSTGSGDTRVTLVADAQVTAAALRVLDLEISEGTATAQPPR